VQDLKGRVEEAVELLGKNQNPVKAKADAIKQVRSKGFWASVEVQHLEELRSELRGIMKYQQLPTTTRVAPQVFDVTDDGHVTRLHPEARRASTSSSTGARRAVLREHFANNPSCSAFAPGSRAGERARRAGALVLQVDDKANVKHLAGHDPETRRSLLTVFRGLVGLDAKAVEQAFTAFVHKHPRLSSQQLRFLQVLQNHIAQNGGIELERLYEPPFTTLHAESVDGIFPDPETSMSCSPS
jgi:type I restriction enzyme R subunit